MENILSNNNYIEESFKGLKLSSKQYLNIEFDSCDFSSCDFSHTSFGKCRFINCTFKNCNLALLSIKESRFNDLTFISCKLLGINWYEAEWSQYQLSPSIKFYDECNLSDSSFFGLQLNKLEIDNCKLHSVDFRDGSFANSILTNNDFTGSLFNETNLKSSDFEGSKNFNISISNNEIKGAKFSRLEALSLLNELEIKLVN